MNKPQTTQRSEFAQMLHNELENLPGSKRMTAEQLEVIYALAYAHVAQQQYEQALPLFAFLSQYGPTRKHYLSGLGLCLQMLERYEEAICIQSLIGTLFPESHGSSLRVAECMLASGQHDEAIPLLKLLIQLLGDSPEHKHDLGRARQLLALAQQEHAT